MIATCTADAGRSLEAAVPRPEVDFRDLVRKHEKGLRAFILRRIGNASDAEELTQQAFVAASRSIAGFRGEAALSTWLYGVAMNLVRNHLTREPGRRHRFDAEAAIDELRCEAANPEERLDGKQRLASLDRELRALPAAMRDVLLLVALHDMSYEEAATLLSVPIGTVRSRVSRARDLLRQRLAGDRPQARRAVEVQ